MSYGVNIRETSTRPSRDPREQLTGNDLYGVRNIGVGTANATCNWWGAVDGPSGEGSGSGDAVTRT